MVALLCVNSFCFSAFAEDYVYNEPIFITLRGNGVYNYSDVSSLFGGYNEIDYINAIEDYYSINLSDYYYYINVGWYSTGKRPVGQIGIFEKDSGLVDDTLFLTDTGTDGLIITNYNKVFKSAECGFLTSGSPLKFSFSNNYLSFRNIYALEYHLGLITNIPNIVYNDESVKNDTFFNYNFSVSDDYIGTLTVTTNSKDDCKFHVSIYNQSSDEPSNATHIPYSVADDFVQKINADNLGKFEFDLQDFKDKCSDMKSYSDKIIISAWCTGDNGVYNEKFFYVDLNDPFTDDNPNKALFAEKKDYISFPDLEDYLYSEDFPDIRDYVNFDMFDEADSIGDYIVAIFQFLWSCLTGFFKWLWAVLKFIFFNLVGLIRWLGACLWTIIENIGVALYNLVVDLRRLVIYLFVPERDELDYIIKEKAPSLTRILSHIQAGKSSTVSNLSFSLFGKEFNLNFSEVIPSDIRLTIRNASTLVFLALQALVGIRKIYRIFGIVGGSDDTSLGGETH